ncbi:MAG: ABC-F family ATP-binding cassette domain-containing protein [Bacteroidales bacterium]|nr:ABC-F family ATP-binding cassette domain-containing protein [Bacteroidales bacterium]MCF8403788.1 ABC-F family ATP-binding cassette domain-containing protein [Bacteroidales bacterium]
MNYLSAELLSKTYGDKTLFEDLSFGLNKGVKTALIANNGAGKSTLLKILAGEEEPDSGQVVIRKGIRIGFLKQEPVLDASLTIDELIKSANTEVSQIILKYEKVLSSQSNKNSLDSQKELEEATLLMDQHNAWDYERRLKQLLDLFRITDTHVKIELLSGGERKRLALAITILDNPHILFLDEPTNHLDIEMIEWLEKFLSQSGITLLMVTHDRYFLDRVCDQILELNNGRLFAHNGNYEYFLQKRQEREEGMQVETDKARQLMKKELEWLRRMPKARTHKSKSRIQAFDIIKQNAAGNAAEKELKLEVTASRLGGKILEIENISKSYGKIKIIEKFSHLFKKGERIGIIGPNGSGKTSFLNLLVNIEKPDKGNIEVGQTVVMGYYQQSGMQLDEDKTVIEVAKDIAEVVKMGNGQTISASKFLEHFLFSPEVQYKPVSKLSGGEKRRLNLLTVLIHNPNFLILDEPTNDLDLLVLNRLEEFLMNFSGCLLIVSHDRYFLDKLTDHLFIFEGEGQIKDYYGPYSKYFIEKEKKAVTPEKQTTTKPAAPKPSLKTKLSFNEKREYEKLEKEIEILEQEKNELEEQIGKGDNGYEKLTLISHRISEILKLIDQKTDRWMELDEYV